MSAVWCADETFLGDLIYLDEGNLVIDSPDDEKAKQMKQALLGGTPAAQVLSSDSVNIPLLAVTSIRTDRNDEDSVEDVTPVLAAVPPLNSLRGNPEKPSARGTNPVVFAEVKAAMRGFCRASLGRTA